LDGCTQARSSCADHQNVVRKTLEFGHLQDSPVMPDAHGTEAHVDVGEADRDQAGPGPFFVARVQPAYRLVEPVADGVLRHTIERSANEMTEGVAAIHITGQQDDVYNQDDSPDTDAESVGKEEGLGCVIDEKAPYDIRETKKEAMKILQDEREG